MWIAETFPTAILLGIAGVISACGGLISTVMSVRKTRDEERVACEEKLKELRLEVGALAEQLYSIRRHAE